MKKEVRVRFAPSPTGGLHLGGMRTVLYNYLFARRHEGRFILRIEDTDRTRYVEGAEQYIVDCLKWCGLEPDEGPAYGGTYGPYRQSERKALYRKYAEQLIAGGDAYYAFDTPEALKAMREKINSQKDHTSGSGYDHHSRLQMRNSLSLPAEEVRRLIDSGTPYVIRFKMPSEQDVQFEDLIRGKVTFDSSLLDDKVLLKADGMPTYHLAVVVDDHLMKISHIFRGEEWLSSTPLHILLWQKLGWADDLPEYAHLPLILKPNGKGKLSKRDGERLGFPVYAMKWTDPQTGAVTDGFKERGFLPGAFLNMLALLGWNDGTAQELFSLEEMIQRFSLDRVHKGGAKFDYEKALWFNHAYIKKSPADTLLPYFKNLLKEKEIDVSDEKAVAVLDLIKERCRLLPELWDNSHYFFKRPETWDVEGVKKKWDEEKKNFFQALLQIWDSIAPFDAETLEARIRYFAEEQGLKAGKMLLPLRVMLVGGKFGPSVFAIAEVLGKEESKTRIETALPLLSN